MQIFCVYVCWFLTGAWRKTRICCRVWRSSGRDSYAWGWGVVLRGRIKKV